MPTAGPRDAGCVDAMPGRGRRAFRGYLVSAGVSGTGTGALLEDEHHHAERGAQRPAGRVPGHPRWAVTGVAPLALAGVTGYLRQLSSPP